MDAERDDELRRFKSTARKWVTREAPKDYARELEGKEHEFPEGLWDRMSAAGWHGVGIDEQYGGQGGDVRDQTILARELSRTLAGLSWVWGLTSFAGSKSVGIYGTPEQKERFLPKIAAGELRFSIGFTEPTGGTDLLGAMNTFATQIDGGWVINGDKTWSTGASTSDYILLLARTDRSASKRHLGVTLFLLPRKSEGVKVTPLPKLGLRCLSSCQISLKDAFVPDDLVLGEPGQAWHMLLPTLNNERILLAAFCLGIIDGVLEDALAYMQQREAFGRPIGSFQALQHYVAEIAMMQYQIDLVLNDVSTRLSQGEKCFRETTMAKVIASDAAVKSADMGISILGGMGYSAETDMQRYWRDARLWQIGPVTNEMGRNIIAEQLGLPRSF
ncbi:acyl-CoA dehydrogenase family protein [Conexibacter sp. DBS9H8]|uniref:acyl-CoA dehydrogenase family protein n=1 Tax=Conexibacter sp. DBS9H8 TaxID=2937801 RepID=UPI002010C30D|nr:acyl-CoA dehydrogenase family protein [Conexibacter sp. DBS9H8]